MLPRLWRRFKSVAAATWPDSLRNQALGALPRSVFGGAFTADVVNSRCGFVARTLFCVDIRVRGCQ